MSDEGGIPGAQDTGQGGGGNVDPLGRDDELTEERWRALVAAFGGDLDRLRLSILALQDRDLPALNRLLDSMCDWQPVEPDSDLLLRSVVMSGVHARFTGKKTPAMADARRFLELAPKICDQLFLGQREAIDDKKPDADDGLQNRRDQMHNTVEIFADCADRCLGRRDKRWVARVERLMADMQYRLKARNCEGTDRCSTCVAVCKLASSIAQRLGGLSRKKSKRVGTSPRDGLATGLVKLLATLVHRRVAGQPSCPVKAHLLAHGCFGVFRTILENGASNTVITDWFLGACFDAAKMDMNSEINGEMRDLIQLVEGVVEGSTWGRLPYRARVLLSSHLQSYLRHPRAAETLKELFDRVARHCERGEVHYDDRIIFPGRRPGCELIVNGTIIRGQLLEASCAGVRMICPGWRVRATRSGWTLTGTNGSKRTAKVPAKGGNLFLESAPDRDGSVFWGVYHHDRHEACHYARDPRVVDIRPAKVGDQVEVGVEFSVTSLFCIVGCSPARVDRSTFADALRGVLGRKRLVISNVSKGPANCAAVELQGDAQVLTLALRELRTEGRTLQSFQKKTRTRSVRWTVGGGLWYELRLRSGDGKHNGYVVDVCELDRSWLEDYALVAEDHAEALPGGGRQTPRTAARQKKAPLGGGKGKDRAREPRRDEPWLPPEGSRLVFRYAGVKQLGQFFVEWAGQECGKLRLKSGGQLHTVLVAFTVPLDKGSRRVDAIKLMVKDKPWKLSKQKPSVLMRVMNDEFRTKLLKLDVTGIPENAELFYHDKDKDDWCCRLPVDVPVTAGGQSQPI